MADEAEGRPGTPSPGVKWAGRAALIVVSTLSMVALAEGLLRYVEAGQVGLQNWHTRNLYRPDPDLIYSLHPNVTDKWSTEEFVQEVRTNGIGLRGEELLEPGTRPRILVLGDSQTFGHGVGDEAPYPRRLQALFEAGGEAVEVANAGMQGYGSDQSYKLFVERLRGLEPDLVVFAHYWNDIYDNVSKALYLIEDGQLVELDATGHPTYRLGWLHEVLPVAILELQLTRVLFGALIAVGNEWLAPEDYENRPRRWGRKKLFMQLKNLERMSREDGFRLLVLAVPYRDGEPNYYRYLQQLERSGIPLLDAHADPRWEEDSTRFFYQEDDHLTAAGHRDLAQLLYDFIGERDLLAAEDPRAAAPQAGSTHEGSDAPAGVSR